MKKCRLFFITLLYASISLSIRPSESRSSESRLSKSRSSESRSSGSRPPEFRPSITSRNQATFSLKNSDKKKKIIFYIAVNELTKQVGTLRPDQSVKELFDTSKPTRLYVWEGYFIDTLTEEQKSKLRTTVFINHEIPINKMEFVVTPHWIFEFPGNNKTIHVKWKQGKLQPREGKAKSKKVDNYTKQEGYALGDNVTKEDITNFSWQLDDGSGQLIKVTDTDQKIDDDFFQRGLQRIKRLRKQV